MGLYERDDTANWWCRFEVAGREIKRSTRTADRRAAEKEERRLRAYYESKAPPRRGGRTPGLADLAGKDVERAAVAGATSEHLAALEWQWEQITGFFGVEADIVKVVELERLNAYVLHRRAAGATDSIRRELGAIKRAAGIAHEKGWLPFLPAKWPVIGDTSSTSTKRRGRVHPPGVLAAWIDSLKGEAKDAATVTLVTWLRDGELHRVVEAWIEPAPADAPPDVVALLRLPPAASKTRRKVKKDRIRGLDQAALEALQRRVAAVPAGAPLFPAGSYKTAFRLARQRIGYAVPISLRDLRKTGATWANKGVGIDSARDGLGHTSLEATQSYIGSDPERVLAAAGVVSQSLSRHRKPGTGDKMHQLERAMGLEPTTLSLGIQLSTALEHVSTCSSCAKAVLDHARLTLIDGDPGTGESAQVAAARGVA